MDQLRSTYPDRVPILLANGVPFLWESRDVERVRTEHNLCGLLTGTLPLIPQQNVFLGMPLRLLPEEVVLLLRRRAAVLIDDAHAYGAPTEEERSEYLAHEAQEILDQKERQRRQQEEHRQRMEAAITQESGDARALERRRARQAAKQAKGQAPDETPEEKEQDVLAKMPYVHHTHSTSAHLPAYHPATAEMNTGTTNAYLTLQEAQAAGVWTYPSTLQERARCAAFEALHSKGFFLSTGLRFGGDFVVYPGDPLRYHSHYTATVLATPQQPMAAFHVVASGRLGTAVKKSHLLCQANTIVLDDAEALERRLAGYDDATESTPAPPWGDAEYWSLAWAGFGT